MNKSGAYLILIRFYFEDIGFEAVVFCQEIFKYGH